MSAKPLRLLLGFDYGTKQIGVAVGQAITGQARELCVLKAQNGVPDWNRVEALIKEWQPDAIVVCHDPDRRSLLGFPKFTAADPAAVIARALLEGRTTNPAIACVGVSVNSARLDDSQRKLLFAALERELSVPVFDPIRDGAGALVPGLCDTSRQSGHRA